MHQIVEQTMLVKGKAAGSVLLILIVWSISSSSLLSLPSVQGQTTECPMHRHSIPPSSPTTPNCCRSGPEMTVLLKTANPKPDVAVAILLRSDRKLVPQDVFALRRDEAASPGTPPAKLQLRI